MAESPAALIQSLYEAVRHWEANIWLARRDLEGDGYEVGEYLGNMETWQAGAETDIRALAQTLGIALHEIVVVSDGQSEEEDEDDAGTE